MAFSFCNEVVQKFGAIDMSALLLPRVGMIHSLVSDVNTANFELLSFGGDGKNKTVEVNFLPFMDPAAGTTAATGTPLDICNGGASTFQRTEYEVGFYSAASRNISVAEMRTLCDDKSGNVQTVLQSLVHSVLTNMDSQLLALFNAGRGNTSLGNTLPLAGTAFSVAPITPLYDPIDALRSELFAVSQSAAPIIVGGADLEKYARMIDLGCCNDLGQTVDGYAGGAFMFPDNNLYAATNPDTNWLAYSAGAVQLLEWSANLGVGEFTQGDFLTSTTIQLPIGDRQNMIFDLDIVMSACQKEWTITLSKHYDLAYVPATMFPAGTVWDGGNFMYAIDPA